MGSQYIHTNTLNLHTGNCNFPGKLFHWKTQSQMYVGFHTRNFCSKALNSNMPATSIPRNLGLKRKCALCSPFSLQVWDASNVQKTLRNNSKTISETKSECNYYEMTSWTIYVMLSKGSSKTKNYNMNRAITWILLTENGRRGVVIPFAASSRHRKTNKLTHGQNASETLRANKTTRAKIRSSKIN